MRRVDCDLSFVGGPESAIGELFGTVKYVCKQISRHEYHNFKWSVKGDVVGPGDSFRVIHPVFVDSCLTELVTAETSKEIVQIFSRAGQAISLEEFLNGGVTNGNRKRD